MCQRASIGYDTIIQHYCPDCGASHTLEFNDFPGARENAGRRLTETEIQQVVYAMMQNASVLYGTNVCFDRSGYLFDHQIYILPSPFQGARSLPLSIWDLILNYYASLDSDFFDPNAINIYFVGHVQFATNPIPH